MATTKIYYTIKEIALALGVKESRLRRWEKKFNVRCNQRSASAPKKYHFTQFIKFKEIKDKHEGLEALGKSSSMVSIPIQKNKSK